MNVLTALGAYALVSIIVASGAYLVDRKFQSFALYLLFWPFAAMILGFLLIWSLVITRRNGNI